MQMRQLNQGSLKKTQKLDTFTYKMHDSYFGRCYTVKLLWPTESERYTIIKTHQYHNYIIPICIKKNGSQYNFKRVYRIK
jgi:hypothetical protein